MQKNTFGAELPSVRSLAGFSDVSLVNLNTSKGKIIEGVSYRTVQALQKLILQEFLLSLRNCKSISYFDPNSYSHCKLS